MSGALAGTRVLDLSRVLAGPFCTQILGDMGAEILKIEKPGSGDDTRSWGPPFLKDAQGDDTTESAYYLSVNRNKKSIAVNIKTEEGQKIIRDLAAQSDILIHNYKVGSLEKFGLGYEQIKDECPHLIYCAISGFGQDGPMAREPGYDLLAQAMSGLMACTGEPEGAPMKVGVALSDIITGLNAAIGILGAMNHRQKTGMGQMVDVALTDCTLASLTNLAQYYLTSGHVAPRVGNAHASIVPYQVFEAKDGHLVVAAGNDIQFSRLCDVLGHGEWPADPRFVLNKNRLKNRDILVAMIAAEVEKKPVSHWEKIFLDANIPHAPVQNVEQAFAMEQTQIREMEIALDHPLVKDPIHLVGSPIKFSETPAAYHSAPPLCGQHTREVLETLLNLSSDEVQALNQKGVISNA